MSKRRLLRVAIIVVLLIDIALLSLLGRMVYNKYFRYDFERIYIGIRAAYALENGERIELVLDERKFIREHLFEPPAWIKSMLECCCQNYQTA